MKRLTTILLTAAVSVMAGAQPLLTEKNIDKVLKAMTLEEKAELLVGSIEGMNYTGVPMPTGNEAGYQRVPGAGGQTIPRLGIPPTVVADGPAGLRISPHRKGEERSYYCTGFPVEILLASTWNMQTVYNVGKAMGEETREYGVDVILGPATNIMRNPLCGRNFEYYSEDPQLAGKMTAAMVKGVQSEGVGTSVKHFAVNNQETNRKENDSRVGMRALRELYLKGFEIAVKEGRPRTVMGSYNYVNGVHACEDEWLLTTVLRDEWGWEGVVMSDWDGVVRQADAVSAGCELIEPGTNADREALLSALEDGSLAMGALDRNVRNILELVVKCPSFSGYQYSNNIDRESHRKLLRRIAAESMVLLKNERSVLPLKPGAVGLYGVSSYDLIPANMGVNGVNNGVYHVSLVQGLREAGFTVCPSVLREYTTYIAAEKEKIASAYPPVYMQFFRYPRLEEIIPDSGEAAAEDLGALTVDLGLKQRSNTPRQSLMEQAEANEAAIITLSRSTGEAFDRAASEF